MKKFTIEQIKYDEWMVLDSEQTFHKAIRTLDDILETISNDGIDFNSKLTRAKFENLCSFFESKNLWRKKTYF